jgi:hypothetical protein
MASASETEDNAGNAEENVNPWPYLSEIFRFSHIINKSVVMMCLLCKPKQSELRAYITSPSNLKKHLEVREVRFRFVSIRIIV